MKKWLIRVHRYLAMGLCVPFLAWFASGIAMIYAGGMPRLTPAARLERLGALDLRRVRMSPSDAERKSRSPSAIERVVLLTVTGRPAYRLSALDATTVFADTGELLGGIDANASVAIAAHFSNVAGDKLRYVRELHEPDQWTIDFSREMPVHKIMVDDGRGTEVYVSATLGEVVMVTDRRGRALAWVAAIPHWLYLTPLRARERLWRHVVLWMSALGTVVAAAGLLLAVVQYRARYGGLLRWHYRLGAVFGIFVLSWIFSGWLSMQPWGWASRADFGAGVARALSGGPLDLGRFPPIDAEAWSRLLNRDQIQDIREIELVQVGGEPHYVVRGTQSALVVAGARPMELRRKPFSVESIVERLSGAFPDVPIVESRKLSDYDAYYRDRDRQAPLPVARIKFDDADATWVYIDLATSAVAAQFTRRQRLERWAYHGLHSLDFPFWYDKRPLWDLSVITLCCGGIVLSTIGAIMAWRRVGWRRR